MDESSAFDWFHEEGRIDEGQRLLLRLGRRRLGPTDESTVAALKAIKDLNHIERLADAVLNAESWQELLATP